VLFRSGGLAVPIFEQIVQAVWNHSVPKTVLAPPSAEAKSQLSCKAVEYESDDARTKKMPECFRVDAKGKIIDTRNRLISRENIYAKREQEDVRGARAEVKESWPRRGWGYEPWYHQRWRDQNERWNQGGWGQSDDDRYYDSRRRW